MTNQDTWKVKDLQEQLNCYERKAFIRWIKNEKLPQKYRSAVCGGTETAGSCEGGWHGGDRAYEAERRYADWDQCALHCDYLCGRPR